MSYLAISDLSKIKSYIINRYLYRKVSKRLSSLQESFGLEVYNNKKYFTEIPEFSQFAALIPKLIEAGAKADKKLLGQKTRILLNITTLYFDSIEDTDPFEKLVALKKAILACSGELRNLEATIGNAEQEGTSKKTKVLLAGAIAVILVILILPNLLIAPKRQAPYAAELAKVQKQIGRQKQTLSTIKIPKIPQPVLPSTKKSPTRHEVATDHSRPRSLPSPQKAEAASSTKVDTRDARRKDTSLSTDGQGIAEQRSNPKPLPEKTTERETAKTETAQSSAPDKGESLVENISDEEFLKKHLLDKKVLSALYERETTSLARDKGLKKIFEQGFATPDLPPDVRLLVTQLPHDFIGQIKEVTFSDIHSTKTYKIQFDRPSPPIMGEAINPLLMELLRKAGQTNTEFRDFYGFDVTQKSDIRTYPRRDDTLYIPYSEGSLPAYTQIHTLTAFYGKGDWYNTWIIGKEGNGRYSIYPQQKIYRTIGELRSCHGIAPHQSPSTPFAPIPLLSKSEEALYSLAKDSSPVFLPLQLYRVLLLVKEEGFTPYLPYLLTQYINHGLFLFRTANSSRMELNLKILAITTASHFKDKAFFDHALDNRIFSEEELEMGRKMGLLKANISYPSMGEKITKYQYGVEPTLRNTFSQVLDSSISFLKPFAEQTSKAASWQPKQFESVQIKQSEIDLYKSAVANLFLKTSIFKRFWDGAPSSALYYNDRDRIRLIPIPDGLVFRIVNLRMNDDCYIASIELMPKDAPAWEKGDKRLARFSDFIGTLNRNLLIPFKGHDEVDNWQKGDILVSRGWLSDVILSCAQKPDLSNVTKEMFHDVDAAMKEMWVMSFADRLELEKQGE